MGTFTDELQMVWPFSLANSVRSKSKRLFKDQASAIARDLGVHVCVCVRVSSVLADQIEASEIDPASKKKGVKKRESDRDIEGLRDSHSFRRRLDLKK